MTDTIHSCNYYCQIPACIKAQRDELRDKLYQRTLVGLTDIDVLALAVRFSNSKFVAGAERFILDFACEYEAKLKEKNGIAPQANLLTPEQVLTWLKSTNVNLDALTELLKPLAAPQAKPAPTQEPVTILPDGSAFGVMSFPLPDGHWLYAPNEYRDGEYEPIDLPKPILTHALREAVVAAVRYAVRGATMRGQETDFDPDAFVRNAVYALCGPYTTQSAAAPQGSDNK